MRNNCKPFAKTKWPPRATECSMYGTSSMQNELLARERDERRERTVEICMRHVQHRLKSFGIKSLYVEWRARDRRRCSRSWIYLLMQCSSKHSSSSAVSCMKSNSDSNCGDDINCLDVTSLISLTLGSVRSSRVRT